MQAQMRPDAWFPEAPGDRDHPPSGLKRYYIYGIEIEAVNRKLELTSPSSPRPQCARPTDKSPSHWKAGLGCGYGVSVWAISDSLTSHLRASSIHWHGASVDTFTVQYSVEV